MAGELRPEFALVGCQLRPQQIGPGDHSDNQKQDDSQHDQNAQPTDWTLSVLSLLTIWRPTDMKAHRQTSGFRIRFFAD
jgi:hypothetical protein